MNKIHGAGSWLRHGSEYISGLPKSGLVDNEDVLTEDQQWKKELK